MSAPWVSMRIARTRAVFDRTDLGIIVTAAGEWGSFESELLRGLESAQIPVLVVMNKADQGRAGDTLAAELAANSISAGAHRCHQR